MALRAVDLPIPSPSVSQHRLLRVVVNEDGWLFAIWSVALPGGRTAERSVGVSATLQDLITKRSTFQKLLDDIQADTYPRIGA